MSDPSDGSSASAPESGEGQERYELVYRGNLIYLPFACHLSEVDEEEERERKAA